MSLVYGCFDDVRRIFTLAAAILFVSAHTGGIASTTDIPQIKDYQMMRLTVNCQSYLKNRLTFPNFIKSLAISCRAKLSAPNLNNLESNGTQWSSKLLICKFDCQNLTMGSLQSSNQFTSLAISYRCSYDDAAQLSRIFWLQIDPLSAVFLWENLKKLNSNQEQERTKLSN